MALTYLPNIEPQELLGCFRAQDWERLNSLIGQTGYERLGFDRLFIILSDLQERFGEQRLSILDVGCNNGLFSYCLSAIGHNVTGVDNGIIDTQKRYEKLSFYSGTGDLSLSFVNDRIEDYLSACTKHWDCLLLLSVLHQFEHGYAHNDQSRYSQDRIRELVNLVFSRADKIIYYECPYDEPGFEFQYGLTFLDRFLTDRNKYAVEEIAKTAGPNGVIRQMFAIIPKKMEGISINDEK